MRHFRRHGSMMLQAGLTYAPIPMMSYQDTNLKRTKLCYIEGSCSSTVMLRSRLL